MAFLIVSTGYQTSWVAALKLTTARTLITGCSSDIGRAAALAFHRAGADVWATARDPESIADLAALGMRVLALDVRDDAQVRAAVAAVGDGVEILVNNAGYGLE